MVEVNGVYTHGRYEITWQFVGSVQHLSFTHERWRAGRSAQWLNTADYIDPNVTQIVLKKSMIDYICQIKEKK